MSTVIYNDNTIENDSNICATTYVDVCVSKALLLRLLYPLVLYSLLFRFP